MAKKTFNVLHSIPWSKSVLARHLSPANSVGSSTLSVALFFDELELRNGTDDGLGEAVWQRRVQPHSYIQRCVLRCSLSTLTS